jgi:transcriptional regulator with PAS, ATPase and Fis domain
MPVTIKKGVGPKIPHAVQVAALRAEIAHIKLTSQGKLVTSQYVTEDPFMKIQVSLAEQVRDMDMPVLIVGESGTGKDVLAQMMGTRYTIDSVTGLQNKQPFVAVNCAGITDTLFESEMFGHVRGAYTGSVGARKGFFEAANGGTLFLDEIGDLPLSQQAKILRAIQNKEVIPVGSTDPVHINGRLICATNKDLPKSIAAGLFREDLYYRIAKVIVRTTPLRARPIDILPIASAIIQRNGWTPLGELGPDDSLIPSWAYDRGNVRRLEACLQCRELGMEWSEIEEQWNW